MKRSTLGTTASLEEAIRVGEAVFREALEKSATCPKAAEVPRAPTTLADALAAAQNRDEEKRKRELLKKDVKTKGKQATPLALAAEQGAPTPGLSIGNVNDASAFWMYAEDYFRDITQEDILTLMPVALDPEEDDGLTVPYLGRDPRTHEIPGGLKGKHTGREDKDDDAERRAARGRGKLDMSGFMLNGPNNNLNGSLGPAQLLSPQGLLQPLPQLNPPGQLAPAPNDQLVTAEALVHGWKPDGTQAGMMLNAMTEEEVRAFCKLSYKLGLMDGLPGLNGHEPEKDVKAEPTADDAAAAAPEPRADASAGAAGRGPPNFDTMERKQLEQLLVQVSRISMCEGEGGAAGQLAVPAKDLPQAPCGDYMHPYLRSILQRPCTAYVLNPSAGTGTGPGAGADGHDDDETGMVHDRGGWGHGGGRGGREHAKTPAPYGGRGGKRQQQQQQLQYQQQQPPPLQIGFTPGPPEALPTVNGDGGAAGETPAGDAAGAGGVGEAQGAEPAGAPGAQGGEGIPAATPGGDVGLGSTTPATGLQPQSASGRPTGANASGLGAAGRSAGRQRATVNYSALAGRKDKERDRLAGILRDGEEREALGRPLRDSKTAVPKMKRKPGPKGASSWSMGPGDAVQGGFGSPIGGGGTPFSAPSTGGGQGALGGSALAHRQSASSLAASTSKVQPLFKDDPGANVVTAAVHAVVNEGGPDGTLEEQWTQLDLAADVMAMAPDDEVLAELLALQSELVQQVAINRSRMATVMEAVLEDLPRQRAAAQQRAEWEDQIRNYIQRKAEIKRNTKREKREQEKRQALAALNEPTSPRGGLVGRPRKLSALEGLQLGGDGTDGTDGSNWRGGTPGLSTGEVGCGELAALPVGDADLVDPLSTRAHDEEAVCAICGDGMSVEPNLILFCERCDVAVHQQCYAIHSVPAAEWVCWPCKLYEEQQLAAGLSQSEVRPARWELEARGMTIADLPGGSRSTVCGLCPVRQGAFKRTTDARMWCHVVCGMWHEGPTVLHSNTPDCIDGVSSIKAERWRTPCSICQRTAGAVVKCNYGHCQAFFHPLCGRRAGNYLVARMQPGSKVLRYRAYCHLHSEGQRAKDMQTGAGLGRGLDQLVVSPTAPTPGSAPPAPLSTRPGRRSSAANVGGATPTGSEAFLGMAVAGDTGMGSVGGGGSLPGTPFGGMAFPGMPNPAVTSTATTGVPHGMPGAPGFPYGGQLQHGLPVGMGADAAMPVQGPKRKVGRPPKAKPLPQPPALPAGPGEYLQGFAPTGELSGVLPSTSLQPSDALGSMDLPLPGGSSAAPTTSGGGPAPSGAGFRPGSGSRLSLTAAAQRRAAAAGAEGTSELGLLQQQDGIGAVKAEGRPPRAGAHRTTTPSLSMQIDGSMGAGDGDGVSRGPDDDAAWLPDEGGNRGGRRGTAGTTSRTSSTGGEGGTGGARGGARGRGTASTASGPARPRGMRLKQEALEADATTPGGELWEAAGQLEKHTTGKRSGGRVPAGTGRVRQALPPPATMERLAELEHQRTMLRWGPQSVRQELELARTLADTIRRRERTKRLQYRLLIDLLEPANGDPEGALQLLKDWEWPGGETPNPFSPADLEPPPEETMLERFLLRHGRVVPTQPHDPEDNQEGLQEGQQQQPGGEGVVGPGGTKRGRPAAGSEGAGPSGSAASGDVGEDVPAPPPAKKVRLAGRAAAAAAAAALSRQAQQAAAADASPGAVPGAAAGTPAPAAATPGAEADAAACDEPVDPADLKEIMSGRDWRKRVYMGPDRKWRPKPGQAAVLAAIAAKRKAAAALSADGRRVSSTGGGEGGGEAGGEAAAEGEERGPGGVGMEGGAEGGEVGAGGGGGGGTAEDGAAPSSGGRGGAKRRGKSAGAPGTPGGVGMGGSEAGDGPDGEVGEAAAEAGGPDGEAGDGEPEGRRGRRVRVLRQPPQGRGAARGGGGVTGSNRKRRGPGEEDGAAAAAGAGG